LSPQQGVYVIFVLNRSQLQSPYMAPYYCVLAIKYITLSMKYQKPDGKFSLIDNQAKCILTSIFHPFERSKY